VVLDGVTWTALPLVAEPTLLSIEPLPPENTPVSVVDFPGVTADAPAVKLVIVGAGTTVTVTVAVIEVPALFVTVSV
jgi:hypothetical protein